MTVYKSRSPSKYKSQKYIKSKKIVMVAVARRVRRQVTCLGHFILDDRQERRKKCCRLYKENTTTKSTCNTGTRKEA